MEKNPKAQISDALLELQDRDETINLINQVLTLAFEYCESAYQASLTEAQSPEDVLESDPLLQRISQQIEAVNTALATRGATERIGPENADSPLSIHDWTVRLVFEYLRGRR
ncbi:MAG: hypothetical protein AAB519_03820 [Patescibacteria group bacterium]